MQNRKIYKGVLIKKQITIKIRKNTKEAKCHWQARPTNIVSYLKARHAWFFFFMDQMTRCLLSLFFILFFYWTIGYLMWKMTCHRLQSFLVTIDNQKVRVRVLDL